MSGSWEAQQIHLLVGSAISTATDLASRGNGAQVQSFDTIQLPEGISYLVPNGGGVPGLSDKRPDQAQEAFVIEPVFVEHQPQAILISPRNRRARINGQSAPLAAILREKDALYLDDVGFCHVAVFRRPRVGPTPAELIGKECPVCRTALNGTIYVCACGTAIHVLSEAKPGEKPLECIKVVTECPSGDGRPVVLTEGYSWLPEE